MWILCFLGLHSWEKKTALVKKHWYAINALLESGYDPIPVSVDELTFKYKECRSCNEIKPRRSR